MAAPALAVVADDLSGAAECAVHALLRVSRSSVALAPAPDAHRDSPAAVASETASSDATCVTVDTDSRRLTQEAAVRAVRAAARLVAAAPVVVKKVDSLLRGHVGAEVAALAQELGRTPVVAVANPGLHRIVRDGVLHVAGTPLHQTDLWDVEPTPAPTAVSEALRPLRTVVVPQATVALGVDAVAEALAHARASGLVAVCDAATETDLETVHAAATGSTPEALLVGSGALAAVAARALPLERPDPEPRHGAPSDGTAHDGETEPRPGADSEPAPSVLFVLGTRAPGLADQLAHLRAAHSVHTLLVRPDDLLTDPEHVRRHLGAALPGGVVVVTLDPTAPADPSRARRLAEALADAVAPAADAYDALFLSGGETARAVLDRLGVHALEVVTQIETGTVVSTRPGGRTVVTRPGSFGRPQSLVAVATHLLGSGPTTCPQASSPALTVSTTQSATAPSSATTKENP
ncbi:four-carbon acid sugar kinase family protein [Terrabacter terrigena]|uniref:Four-carbon acid sugar kinase family protein n=1 Tax=Terrabacter terrigena TaxID=574718 RepID=A0ABW3MY65_9MICO